MAKTAKKREVSLHSRAHRRNATPPLEIKSKPRDKSEQENEHRMYTAQSAGVHKKSKQKSMTKQQRARHIKAMEKAGRNMDVLEHKVEESKQRGRKIRERRKDWHELNGTNPDHQQDNKSAAIDDAEQDVMDGGEEELATSLDAIIAHDSTAAQGIDMPADAEASLESEAASAAVKDDLDDIS